MRYYETLLLVEFRFQTVFYFDLPGVHQQCRINAALAFPWWVQLIFICSDHHNIIWILSGFVRTGTVPRAGLLRTGNGDEEAYVDAAQFYYDLTLLQQEWSPESGYLMLINSIIIIRTAVTFLFCFAVSNNSNIITTIIDEIQKKTVILN